MAHASRSTRRLAWIAGLLLGLAFLALVVPLAVPTIALGSGGAAVDPDQPVAVRAESGRTWGIYLDDEDNSGYGADCSILDTSGRAVEVREAGATVTSSETEMLDYLYTTPDGGSFTITCSVDEATARVGPVIDLRSRTEWPVVGTVLALAGCVAWLLRVRSGRSSRT